MSLEYNMPSKDLLSLEGNSVENALVLAEAIREALDFGNRAMGRRLTDRGLSPTHMRVLMHIHYKGNTRAIDLVHEVGYAPRTITEAVDSLEGMGLVQRIPDKTDRRVKHISVTAAGDAKVIEVTPIVHDFVSQILGVLNEAEMKQFTGLLSRIRLQAAMMEESYGEGIGRP